jgi:uncharacterized membrane protein
MDDEAGSDSKVLAVPIDLLTGIYRSVQSPRDLPEVTTQQIAHFFEHYKDLEPGKWVRVSTWVGAEEAKREILTARALRGVESEAAFLSAMSTAAHARRQLAFPFLFVLLWSTGFIAAKYGLAYAPPLTFLLYRFVLVAALMAIVAVATRAVWPATLAEVGHVAVSAWLVHGVYLGGVLSAIAGGMSAGMAAMLVGLQPILTVLLARGWLGERVVPRQWLGLALGLAGVWLVVGKPVLTDDGRPRRDCVALAGTASGRSIRSGTAARRSALRRRHLLRRARSRTADRVHLRARAVR